jgi:16S rRNA (cytosine1402-N4)-methyltransferase
MVSQDSTPSPNWATEYHAPVLIHPVLEILRAARSVLDCTLGGGGHTAALLEGGANVTALDQDPDAIAEARRRLSTFEDRGQLRLVRTTFGAIDETPALEGIAFDGILADLGVSSHQLDDPNRGFSFREGAPLDMRMDPSENVDAAYLLNKSDESELAHIFREYGDEPRARSLARQIARRRANRPFTVSDDLVGAIRATLGPRSGPSEFARLFQAVRIAVNNEIEQLRDTLPILRDRLTPEGVMVVIAYHSGEDRIVKNAFRDWSRECICPPRQPICTCRGRALGEEITRRPIVATEEEIATNPRARSARLRAWRLAA